MNYIAPDNSYQAFKYWRYRFMPVERKPIDLNFYNMEEQFLRFLLKHYDFGGLYAVSPFILSGPYLELLEVRSQTSKKLILYTQHRTYFLKQIPWYCDGEIELRFSHSFQTFLKEKGFPLPKILRAKNGSTFVEYKKQKFFVSEFVEGSLFQNQSNDIETVAECLAQLHNISKDFVPLYPYPQENLGDIVRNHIILARNIADGKIEDTHLKKEIFNILNELLEVNHDLDATIESSGILNIPPIAVHGDFIPWNIAFEGCTVSAVYDFDNCCMDSRLHDVGEAVVAFFGLDYRGQSSNHMPEIRDHLDENSTIKFLKTYHSVAPLRTEQITALPCFITGAWLECLLLGFIRGDHQWEMVSDLFKIINYMQRNWTQIIKEALSDIVNTANKRWVGLCY